MNIIDIEKFSFKDFALLIYFIYFLSDFSLFLIFRLNILKVITNTILRD